MKYENRQPAEGINITKHNPLLHFFKLMLAAAVFVILLVVVVNRLGATLAAKIPFSYEQKLMHKVDYSFGDTNSEISQYLEGLSEELALSMPVPEGMSFQIHYDNSPVFNAYATLGGNLVFHRGLLEKMPNENALSMVLAHEMSHVLHRHPASGVGGGLASTLVLVTLSQLGGSELAGSLLNRTGSLTQLTFSRDMESTADNTAIKALVSHYGHVEGAADLFRVMSGDNAISKDSLDRARQYFEEFSSTHPLDSDRVAAIENEAEKNGWSLEGDVTALPSEYMQWLLQSEN